MISSRRSSAAARQLPHAQVVDDQQRDGRGLHYVVLARTGEGVLCEFFEQRVGLAVDDAIALLDRRTPDRLDEMTLGRYRAGRMSTSLRYPMKRAVASS